MNILVTGSSGFVGSHLISKLRELKHNVVGMDIKKAKIGDTMGFSTEDVRSYPDCLVHTKDIDCVVHLAAFTDVQESLRDKMTYCENNIQGTVNLLEASRANGVKRFIFVSSAAADNPQSPYGVTKLCGEAWCDVFQKCYGLSTVSLRFFNVFGKGTDKGVIPNWIDKIKKGERLTVYGGNQVRDFIYVEDVVRVIICAMDKNTYDANGVFEVGAGVGTSIDELFFAVTNAMNVGENPILKPQPKGEIQESIARDTERTLDCLGWQAKYSLKQGLEEMLK